MWAYPQEFKSADAAGQVTDSPYRFIRVTGGSPLFWLVRGYAILDDPSMPIIGEGKNEPNDTYVEQLVASAQAAVDELVKRGVGDRNRMAIGGHSYGAFMTANLLAHSDLFRAGIARSGAYNRTLTPFSFQAEERTFWEATDTYIKMSPFTFANKINEPILLIHGMDDNNTGTFPIQSERLYQALKGLGGTARLVMLPYEAHGYRARESVLHVLYEMDRWLDLCVKNYKEKK
jgi:dipeptidyl aminopeptidase/acylaminoacyl peptidase